MSEVRKKLTDTQFRLLVDAQIKYDKAVVVLKETSENLNKMRALVLDAHGVAEGVEVYIDPSAQELVISEAQRIKNAD